MTRVHIPRQVLLDKVDRYGRTPFWAACAKVRI
jgi:hypothetical protein